MKEIDFLVIYSGLSLTEAYALPTIRRKIFLNNYSYFKDIERKETEKVTNSSPQPQPNPSFNKVKFK